MKRFRCGETFRGEGRLPVGENSMGAAGLSVDGSIDSGSWGERMGLSTCSRVKKGNASRKNAFFPEKMYFCGTESKSTNNLNL